MACGLAVFDLDGTLVDSREDLAAAGNAAREALGLQSLPISAIMGYVGEGVAKLIERLTPDGDALQRARASEVFFSSYLEVCCHSTRPYLGIAEALEQLRRDGWVLAVATNKNLHFTERILEHCGIRPFFAQVRGGDTMRKPEPGQLLEIIAATADLTSACPGWMIGDHHTDIQAGHAAGLQVAWCAWGIGHRQGLAVEQVLETPAHIPSALRPRGVHE